jgi:ribosomal protein S27AE
MNDTHHCEIFLWNNFVAALDLPNIRTNGGASTFRRSIRYICPRCGSVWAHRIWDAASAWTAEERICAECGDGHLLYNNEIGPHTTAELPPEFIRRELAARLISMENLT